jgi:DNA adenine methylase
MPYPFLKWVGGKRQLLPELLARVPRKFSTYHEPFVGGGALFLALRPAKAVLYDNNLRLIRTWRAVRDNVDDVIDLLSSFPHDRSFYLTLRDRDVDRGSDAEVAAWLIYLNKTGYNGLYRVNSRNRFNVPFGSYRNPTICDAENLRACSAALRAVEVVHGDFELVRDRVTAGDLVYFDPPYVPLSATAYFTNYTADGFGEKDQIRLRDLARYLKRAGVNVLLSNSSADFVRRIYGRGFRLEEVLASRAINCKASGRGKVPELVIR